jgi:hypothetical protein
VLPSKLGLGRAELNAKPAGAVQWQLSNLTLTEIRPRLHNQWLGDDGPARAWRGPEPSVCGLPRRGHKKPHYYLAITSKMHLKGGRWTALMRRQMPATREHESLLAASRGINTWFIQYLYKVLLPPESSHSSKSHRTTAVYNGCRRTQPRRHPRSSYPAE